MKWKRTANALQTSLVVQRAADSHPLYSRTQWHQHIVYIVSVLRQETHAIHVTYRADTVAQCMLQTQVLHNSVAIHSTPESTAVLNVSGCVASPSVPGGGFHNMDS